MSEKKYGEVINPSDAYTICIDDPLAACVAVALLTNGKWGIKDADGNQVLPMFIFGGFDEWWKEQGTEGLNVDDWLEKHGERLIEPLESVLIGDRWAFDQAASALTGEDLERFRQEWHERYRTSMNDFGKCAKAWAVKLRKAYGTEAVS